MIIVVLPSVTTANRVKKYIKQNYNKDVYIVQIPKLIENAGCGYAIKTDSENIDFIYEATDVLKTNVKGIYNAETFEKIEVQK
jgi:hypothetical protein